jgi:hypothetical protein
MPRPTEQGLLGAHNSQGFTPGTPSTFTTPVVAPLDVEGAPQQAVALARALGHANETVQTVGAEKAREQGSANEALGETDAKLNQVDPEKMKRAIGYADGVQKTQAEQVGIQASNAALQFLASHQDMPMQDATNADGTVTKGFARALDDTLRAAVPVGFEKLPEHAHVLAPLLNHVTAEILGKKNALDIARNQRSAEDAASSLLMHDVQTGSSAFDLQDQLTKLTQVYGGDRSAGRDALVKSIGEAAVSTGQPSIIDHLLPHNVDFGGGAGLTPENQAYLDNARNRATVAEARNNKSNLQQQEMAITVYAAHGHDPQSMLDEYSKLPGSSHEFYWSTLDHYRANSRAMDQDAADGGFASTLYGDIAAGKVTTQAEIFQRIATSGAKGRPADEILTRASSALGEHNRLQSDDPVVDATRKELAEQYKPGLDPTGRFTLPSQANQYAGILKDFDDNARKNLNQGMSSAEAAHRASVEARDKWGAPLSVTGGDGSKLPKDNADLTGFATPQGAAAVRDAWKNPNGIRGMTGKDVQALRDSGAITPAEANLAAAILKRFRTTK